MDKNNIRENQKIRHYKSWNWLFWISKVRHFPSYRVSLTAVLVADRQIDITLLESERSHVLTTRTIHPPPPSQQATAIDTPPPPPRVTPSPPSFPHRPPSSQPAIQAGPRPITSHHPPPMAGLLARNRTGGYCSLLWPYILRLFMVVGWRMY